MFSLSTTARKALAITSIAALSLGATACNRGESSDGEGGGSVTLALSTQTNPFFVELRDGAQAKADELGIELDVEDASDDAAARADRLRSGETSVADAVIVNPTDSAPVGSAVVSLHTADIPVIAVDRSSSAGVVASVVASDTVAGGKHAAQALAESIGEEGDIL